ncbi:trypsin-like serine peptidase [Pseudonocardia sp. H11422]|uniref:trypsin-like serine peptidase n=1 Tax=Pseudonocardia sp. H11422 TaxID=2835866 RepID=UPI001BDD690E|nr:serine protease [Pseudonocardia sp. H11422]
MDLRQQQQKAAERFERSANDRLETEHQQEATGSPIADTADQIEARARRLLSSGQIAVETLATALPDVERVGRVGLLERIIAATNDLQLANFLPRGERAARTVARICLQRGGRVVGFGTGFLVGPQLMMTNNHVLPDVATAGGAYAEFVYELDRDGVQTPAARYDLDPATLFLTDEHLDFTLVATRPAPDGHPPGEEFGWNRLVAQQGKIVNGEPVNVVGHPNGRLKEIAIRHNKLLNQLDDFLQYETDTEPGNSGSPVFNDQWEVVALHHSGVPRTDDAGNWLAVGGARWRPQDGDAAVDWVANEGARVSVLLSHLSGLALSPAQRAVLAELGTTGAPVESTPVPPAAAPSPVAGPEPVSRTGVAGRPLPNGRSVVFLHGRGQQGKDSAMLRAAWAGGLARGLVGAGLAPLDAADVWFPFYGDALVAALDGRPRGAIEKFGGSVEVTTVEACAPATPSALMLYSGLIRDAAQRAGMPGAEQSRPGEAFLDNIVAALQLLLSFVADRSGLDDVVIATVFSDVAAYLDREEIREAVLDSVLGNFPRSGPVVLVSHSLGTVVALDLLTRLPAGADVDLLVTAGSPLGMDGVYKRLLAGGPQPPARVREWVNAWCAADAVAIGCPLRPAWGDPVRDILTDNPKDRAHDIAEYLADNAVARAIGATLAP